LKRDRSFGGDVIPNAAVSTAVVLAPVASIHVLNTALDQ
jgi:hypothetical protein